MGYARRSPEGLPAAIAASEEDARDAVRALSRQARGSKLCASEGFHLRSIAGISALSFCFRRLKKLRYANHICNYVDKFLSVDIGALSAYSATENKVSKSSASEVLLNLYKFSKKQRGKND